MYPALMFEPCHEKTCLLNICANSKGADQPAHQHSVINAFVVRNLESIITSAAVRQN